MQRTQEWESVPHLSRHNRKMADLARRAGQPVRAVAAFDLPAGYTCPAARDCKAWAHEVTGKLTDGPGQQFRCYAASLEAAFPTVRKLRWRNFRHLERVGIRNVAGMAGVLTNMLEVEQRRYGELFMVRIHTSGDYMTQEYMDAWLQTIGAYPNTLFYSLTKCAHMLSSRESKPHNVRYVISYGGNKGEQRLDYPRSFVVTPDQTANVPVYHDAESDLACLREGESYGLLIHGTQPARR